MCRRHKLPSMSGDCTRAQVDCKFDCAFFSIRLLFECNAKKRVALVLSISNYSSTFSIERFQYCMRVEHLGFRSRPGKGGSCVASCSMLDLPKERIALGTSVKACTHTISAAFGLPSTSLAGGFTWVRTFEAQLSCG